MYCTYQIEMQLAHLVVERHLDHTLNSLRSLLVLLSLQWILYTNQESDNKWESSLEDELHSLTLLSLNFALH